ncbi:MAG: hypothetical protein L3J76_04530 [Candidatus Hydrothermae bacterium]|nr:hypothetical protein [Candidatus Hydrothermae bacterium]
MLIRRLSDSQNPWGFPQHAAFSSQWKRGFIQDSCVVDTGLSPATFWSAGAILTVGPADSGLDMRFRDTLILEGVSTTQPYRILLHSAATFRVDTFLVARAVRDTVLRVPLRGLWARNLWAMEIMPTRPASRASFCVRSVRVSDANPEKLARVLVDRAERMRNLADTTGLAKMVQLVENLPDPSPSLRYAAAYAAWRLIPLVEGRAQTTWIRKGLQFTRPDDPGELLALRYSLLGWLAGHSTWEAIRRGREMNRLARALENGGTPHGWLVLGVSKLFTPSMFGGNIDQAIDFLDRARKALVSCEEGTFACWGEDDAYAFLYQAYKKKQEHEKARKVLKEGVERHPESTYLWILYLEEVTGQ